MKLDEFDYHLPPEKIAQHPEPRRDHSRLLVVRPDDKSFEPAVFSDLPGFIDPGDLLVVNDTRVMPLRLSGTRPTGGRAEITLLRKLSDEGVWECLVAARKPAPGMVLSFPEGLKAELLQESREEVGVSAREGAPLWLARVFGASVEAVLGSYGRPPLPPYIRRGADDDPGPDQERYQTVYARAGLAAAAPTAGLHFTPDLLDRVRARGAEIVSVRLDVGYGTFSPVREENIEDHHMHPESYEVTEEAARRINAARTGGSRVIAVGTTSARVLEHCALEAGHVLAGRGETSLFIYPGFFFRVVDAMITNFHLPKSTLLMLVSAFAGKDLILDAYRCALESGFKFLSYGDAMLIIPGAVKK